ncbi:hypothetical protein [Lysinibacillus fusiformis]|uniref:hypothetical protein n=1 Tax=Lysinibacillus fusiformis TaxID=28031 RepID=UPI00263AD114|nr:hypothetical protein [Lysinibacillus fusiformis]MDC6267721.1 hypothetical protein [Lysinibacillus sphaericus]MDN4967789.1 hypothetical protein [Lysinibacillus fusiformis]MDN4967845.1 hypothetical protein [Lysinibacillus fusiformis]
MTKVAAATSKSAQELLRYQQNNGYLNDVRLESFGFFLDNYVIYGGDLTFDTVDAYKLLLSEGIISLNDQLWRAFIKEFRINKYNTTYYVGFLHEKGYVIGETEPAENYMRLWTIPVDANGIIGVPIDHRNMYGYLKFKAKYDGVYLNVDEVQQAITNANSAADKANEAASDVQGAVDEAKRAANQANEAVVKTETVLKNVSSSLSQLDKSIEDANKAIGESNTATASAKQAAQDAISAKDNLSNAVNEKINQTDTAIKNANDAAGVANQASEAIKGWGNKRQWNKEQYYEKNNIVTYNGSTWQALRPNKGVVPVEGEDWTCLAQKGVDGTGAVSSVNGNFPDENGNVELDIQQGTVQKVNGKSPDDKGEVTLVASDLGEMSGDQLTDESVSLAKLAHDVQDAIKKAGGNSFFIPYPLSTTMENQKTWDLPANSYDAATDSLLVFHNRGILDKESWTITGDPSTGYTLVIPENPIIKIEENNVIIIVLKNAPSEIPASFSGTLLTPGSVGLEKLGQDVQDAINNAGGKIVIVNDFTTGGADKAASAETVKVLKNQVDGNRKVITNLEQTVSQNQEAVTESVGNLQQTVTNNQQVVTEHLGQMATAEKAGHVKLVNNLTTGGTDAALTAEQGKVIKTELDKVTKINTYTPMSNITNLNQSYAIRTLDRIGFKSNVKSEQVVVSFPAVASFEGVLKVTIASTYANSDNSGGGVYVFHFLKPNDNNYIRNDMDIISLSPKFAENFYVFLAPRAANQNPLLIIDKKLYNNPISVTLELVTANGSTAFDILNGVTVSVAEYANNINFTPQKTTFARRASDKIYGTLKSGWEGSLTYRKNDSGLVTIEIDAIAGSIALNETIASLPSEYLPSTQALVMPVMKRNDMGVANLVVYSILSGIEGIKVPPNSNLVAGQTVHGTVSYYAKGV